MTRRISPLGLRYRWNSTYSFLEAAWEDQPDLYRVSNVPRLDLILADEEETRLVIAARDEAVDRAMGVE